MSDAAQRGTCKGVKKDGTPCNSRIVLANGYCRFHQDQARVEPEPAEAEEQASQEPETAEPPSLTRRGTFSPWGLKNAVRGFLGWVTSRIASDVTGPVSEDSDDVAEKPINELEGDVREPFDDTDSRVPDLAVESRTLPRGYSWEPDMVLIPAGEFLMGSDPNKDRDAMDREQPQHVLCLPDYYLAMTPITNTQYAAFVRATGHVAPRHWRAGRIPDGRADHPVVFISRDDAITYCNWLAQVTGKPYRLPTEAEWEKGARGTDGRIYPWGNDWDSAKCNTMENEKLGTTLAGAYAQGVSPYGLLDMAGNVWEWTSSLSGTEADEPEFGYPYDSANGRENLEASGGEVLGVLRGGSFLSSATYARCAYRFRTSPDGRDVDYGFRAAAVPFSLFASSRPLHAETPGFATDCRS